MIRQLMAVVLAWTLAGGIAVAQDTPASDASQNSIKLSRVVVDMPAGTPWLSLHVGLVFCLSNSINQAWTQGRADQRVAPYAAPFKTALEQAGYKVVTPGDDNLFDDESGSADLEAAAVITDEHIDGCVDNGEYWGTRGAVRGESAMHVDWQLYSRLKKQVVARISTSGSAKLDSAVTGGVTQLVVASFAENVRKLLQNADFRAAMTAPKAFTAGFQMPGQQSAILLAGSLKAGPRKIADATGSVVTILNGIGSGSGVLISSDGYILTDAHVVGDDKQARIRWSDGIVTLGQVVRVSKNRDVALIKTNPRDREPLALKRGPVIPGQRVYAIGSPLNQKLQGTVSSGVISADRIFDGLRYIQSDTVVSPGSSGGPLLDENGAVIGLTDLGIMNNGPAGLNLFTPIGDAMDFLALKPN